jgi:hypothetical protein
MTTSREIAVLCPCNDLLRLGRLGENGAGGRVGARVLVHFAVGPMAVRPGDAPTGRRSCRSDGTTRRVSGVAL